MESQDVEIKEEKEFFQEENESTSSMIKQEFEEILKDFEVVEEEHSEMICEPEIQEYDLPYESLETNNEKTKFLCALCNASFMKVASLEKHVATAHEGNKPFQCEECKVSFTTKGSLTNHNERVHQKKKPLACPQCDFRCLKTYDMKNHIATVHEGKKPHQCSYCSFSCGIKNNLNRHIRNVHEGIKPFTCIICNKGFGVNSNLKYHMDSAHIGEKPYKCSDCDASFALEGKLTKHMIDVHEGKEQKFDCPYCHKSFAKNSGIQRHVKAVHEKPPLDTGSSSETFQFASCNDITEKIESSEACEVKDNSYLSKDQSDIVNDGVPGNDETIDNSELDQVHEENKHQCQLCNIEFKSKNALHKHIKSVHKVDKLFQCSICDFSCGVMFSLTRHYGMVHEKKRPHPCTFCDKCFTQKSDLKRHIKVVHEKKETAQKKKPKVENGEYSQSFSELLAECKSEIDNESTENREHNIKKEKLHKKKSNLKCSELSVSPSDPLNAEIKCEVDSESAENSEHNELDQVHKEKSHQCLICNAMFDVKSALNKHVKSVHDGEKLLQCPSCDYNTLRTSALKDHISAVHEENKPFQCLRCNFSCGIKHNLNRHIRIVHENKKPHKKKSIVKNNSDLSPRDPLIAEIKCEIDNESNKDSEPNELGLVFQKKTHPCFICNIGFHAESALDKHNKSFHKGGKL